MRQATKLWYPVSLIWLNLVDPFPSRFRAACFVAWSGNQATNLNIYMNIHEPIYPTYIQYPTSKTLFSKVHPTSSKTSDTQGSSWSREVVGGFLEQKNSRRYDFDVEIEQTSPTWSVWSWEVFPYFFSLFGLLPAGSEMRWTFLPPIDQQLEATSNISPNRAEFGRIFLGSCRTCHKNDYMPIPLEFTTKKTYRKETNQNLANDVDS